MIVKPFCIVSLVGKVVIKGTYDIDLGVRQCQRLFHELGFSLIRPQTYPSIGEQNQEERDGFKKN